MLISGLKGLTLQVNYSILLSEVTIVFAGLLSSLPKSCNYMSLWGQDHTFVLSGILGDCQGNNMIDQLDFKQAVVTNNLLLLTTTTIMNSTVVNISRHSLQTLWIFESVCPMLKKIKFLLISGNASWMKQRKWRSIHKLICSWSETIILSPLKGGATHDLPEASWMLHYWGVLRGSEGGTHGSPL